MMKGASLQGQDQLSVVLLLGGQVDMAWQTQAKAALSLARVMTASREAARRQQQQQVWPLAHTRHCDHCRQPCVLFAWRGRSRWRWCLAGTPMCAAGAAAG
jgi:hypothetical protein